MGYVTKRRAVTVQRDVAIVVCDICGTEADMIRPDGAPEDVQHWHTHGHEPPTWWIVSQAHRPEAASQYSLVCSRTCLNRAIENIAAAMPSEPLKADADRQVGVIGI